MIDRDITQFSSRMASRYETPGLRFHHFEQARARLSDNLVGLVAPRAQGTDRDSSNSRLETLERAPLALIRVFSFSIILHFAQYNSVTLTAPWSNIISKLTTRGNNEETTSKHISLTDEWSQGPRQKNLYEHQTIHVSASNTRAGPMSPGSDQEKVGLKRKCMRSEIRREQCRANQARYRNKQRNLQLRLEASVEELRQELCHLKRRRQDIVLAEKTDQNPWIIVAEVFRILQNSFRSPWNLENDEAMKNDIETRKNLDFVQKTFTADVAMGDLNGIDELISRWRRYSQYFGDARIYLQHVEWLAPGVMTATARLHVTISELIVRFAFPHLSEIEP
ncbi:hypothetical protein GN958_ATG13328, partial [Phytophthora infestans]